MSYHLWLLRDIPHGLIKIARLRVTFVSMIFEWMVCRQRLACFEQSAGRVIPRKISASCRMFMQRDLF
jgi:hypothetical protein